jgi:hypothetical protein
MRNCILFLAVMFGCLRLGVAQQANNSTNYYEHIQPIIYKHCAPCHQPNGAGPFNLLTYEDVAKRANFINQVVQSRYMPPWQADPSYRSFANERWLDDDDINKIEDWIKKGMPKGKKNINPKTISVHVAKEKADLNLKMNSDFLIPNNNTDDFRFFSLPTNLPENGYIQSIEFIPGNKKLVHHSRIMADTTNKIRQIDGLSETDPKVLEFQKFPLYDEFAYGWVPGNYPIKFPKGMGKKIYKNTDLILNIHYAPTPIVEKDKSEVKIYLAKEPVDREVYTYTMNEKYLVNPPFIIPANQYKTFHMSSGPLEREISLLAILPHMHQLGKSFKAYAITPEDKIINLIKINEWDFNWQTTYQFQSLIHLPKYSIIYVEGVFDNTAQNPANPHTPPQQVGYGWRTIDEMLNFIIYYADYQNGDESLDIQK